MAYLVEQMLILLVASALIGFWMGWSIRTVLSRRELKHLEKTWRINLASHEEELQSFKKKS